MAADLDSAAMGEGTAAEPPLPPAGLISAVGHGTGSDAGYAYLVFGEDHKATIADLLGPGWDWSGKRVLDFGCGSGRLLRHLLAEAEVAEIHGCDISAEMVAWVDRNLRPPIASALVNAPSPPLSYPDAHFDLVTAISIFTHIADGWSEWLLEMHRILKPGGILIATFMDSCCAAALGPLPWDEERVGMSSFGFADPEMSWPNVLHSQWWLREHWGRAFEIDRLVAGKEVSDEGGAVTPTQGWAVLRRREVALAPADLEREDPADDRYREARRYQLELLRAEGEELKRRHRRLAGGASRRITALLRRAKALLSRR